MQRLASRFAKVLRSYFYHRNKEIRFLYFFTTENTEDTEIFLLNECSAFKTPYALEKISVFSVIKNLFSFLLTKQSVLSVRIEFWDVWNGRRG
jgi:hypothetical protein